MKAGDIVQVRDKRDGQIAIVRAKLIAIPTKTCAVVQVLEWPASEQGPLMTIGVPPSCCEPIKEGS